MSKADIGLIGLAVMGQNLVLNMNDHGFTVAVFNRTVSKVDEFLASGAKGTNVIGVHSGSYGIYRALAVAAGRLDPAVAARLLAQGGKLVGGVLRRPGALLVAADATGGLAGLDGDKALHALHGQVVLVEGEAGIGKSRVVDEWI